MRYYVSPIRTGPMTRRFNQSIAIRALVVLFLLTLAYRARVSWEIVVQYLDPRASVQDPFSVALPGNRVGAVSRSAESAGLRKDDLLIEVNGRAVSGIATIARAIRNSGPGTALRLTINRGGNSRTFAIPLEPQPPRGWGRIAFELLLRLFTP